MPERRFIPLMVPDIREDDIFEATKVLQSGMLVQGLQVELFEIAIASFLGVKNAIAVSNGTAALHLSLIALDIKAGDEVIVPALSFMATANVVELVGAKPVFVDTDPLTFNIDILKIEEAITPRTKAIIPVHEFGLAADITEIVKIAKAHSILVIEDAACALGATEEQKQVGTFGDLGSFSFHPRKAITSGEGGMIVTNNDELTEKLKTLRNHGIKTINNKMEFILPGFNYRMTDIQAALLKSQFLRFPDILAERRKIADIYSKEIKNNKIITPYSPDNKEHTWQTYHILLEGNINRDDTIVELRNKNLGTNLGAQCMPDQQFFQKKYKHNCKKAFPNALSAQNSGLAIPLYNKLSSNEINYIIETLNKL